jgi:hypothetical protein
MEKRIQLQHPEGKKAPSMESVKYEVLRKAILAFLKTTGPSAHTDMLHGIVTDFQKRKVVWEGSLEWSMEWVKLDLEAKKEIKRTNDTPPSIFEVA